MRRQEEKQGYGRRQEDQGGGRRIKEEAGGGVPTHVLRLAVLLVQRLLELLDLGTQL